ncbi:MAG: hypothetical protein AAGA48_28685 [Myxococcota bacterium]
MKPNFKSDGYPGHLVWPVVDVLLLTERASTIDEALAVVIPFVDRTGNDFAAWTQLKSPQHPFWAMLRAALLQKPRMAFEHVVAQAKELAAEIPTELGTHAVLSGNILWRRD